MTLDFILGKDVLEFDVMETNGIKKGVLNDLVLYFTGSFINAVKDVIILLEYSHLPLISFLHAGCSLL